MGNDKLKRILIAGTHSGVGKTTITLGIMSLLSKQGLNVQGFKSGPDYIDISHHAAVTGKMSRNLDTWMMEDNVCRELFYRTAIKSEISVIEGVMGLYDGSLNDNKRGSSAYLAKILNTPVILVIDVKGMAQSAGAVALGFKTYDKDLQIKGIILNRVGSKKQFDLIRSIIENSIEIPVLGYLGRNKKFSIPERHLGLVPYNEDNDIMVDFEIGKCLEDTLDIEKIIEIATNVKEFPKFDKTIFTNLNKKDKPDIYKPTDWLRTYNANSISTLKLAVAMDKAFHFYYKDNLELLETFGAELCFFSPLHDKKLPEGINGIYIGGGFPELFGQVLEGNKCMRHLIKEAAANGVVIYAECGGMMYLLDKLVDCNGKSYIMCGVFHAVSKMESKRQGLGYINVNSNVDNILCKKGDHFKAHEFHWSSIVVDVDNSKDMLFAYKISKGVGGKVKFDGLYKDNVLASYAHVHFGSNPAFAINLLRSMSRNC